MEVIASEMICIYGISRLEKLERVERTEKKLSIKIKSSRMTHGMIRVFVFFFLLLLRIARSGWRFW